MVDGDIAAAAMSKTFSADQPELRAIAQLAGVAPSRMAAAYNDPEHFLDHLNLEEMKRIQAALERLMARVTDMAASTIRAAEALEKGIGNG